MKEKYIDLYMKFAEDAAELSYARRLKVGAVVVKGHQMWYGYNGTPYGADNNCEYENHRIIELDDVNFNTLEQRNAYEEKLRNEGWTIDESTSVASITELVTKPNVIHAELNAVIKSGRQEGATLFCTHLPCEHCAGLIVQAGIKQVYFKHFYRSTNGLEALTNSGIVVTRYLGKLDDLEDDDYGQGTIRNADNSRGPQENQCCNQTGQ